MMSNIAFSENGCVKYFFCAVVVRKACTTFLLPPRAGQETPDDCFLSSVRNAAKVRVNRGQERPWKGQNEEGKLSIRPLRRMRSGAPFFCVRPWESRKVQRVTFQRLQIILNSVSFPPFWITTYDSLQYIFPFILYVMYHTKALHNYVDKNCFRP